MMMHPYGSWKSPILSQHLVEETLRFGPIAVDDSDFYYIEGRPSEKGRSVLMQGSLQNAPHELLPKEWGVRTKVHEYGGKCILAHHKIVYFVRDTDQDIYARTLDGQIKRITEEPTLRFADFSIAPDSSFLYAVAEQHEDAQVNNMLVRISLQDSHIEVLASGYDFYAAPRVSPDGHSLAWFCWNHPNMPWDGTELWTGTLSPTKGLIHTKKIAGNAEESITTPLWSPHNVLHFVSDRTGYWNLYKYNRNQIEPLCPCSIEFGAPHWVFGIERYCFLNDNTLLAIGTTQGRDALYHIDPMQHSYSAMNIPFTSISNLYLVQGTAVFYGGSPTCATSLIALDPTTSTFHILKKSQAISLDVGYIAPAQEIAFATAQGKTAYGFYYPPTNKDYSPTPHTKPPLIMRCHGGPTDHVSPRLSLDILYFTSRGFAFFEINYGGSSGYGREYRNRLRGNWGVVDVQDCLYAAESLCKQGLAEPSQLIIKGSSSGGLTTLCALISGNTFQTGASYYGVSDLELLSTDTHKMELHYLERLIGPYPEHRDTYIERSPIHHIDRLKQPVVFFQGTEDNIVPPTQTEKIYTAIVHRKIPTAYLLFQHEGHGFRRSETIKKCIETELVFYSKIFHFPLSEKIPPTHLIVSGTFSSSGINF